MAVVEQRNKALRVGYKWIFSNLNRALSIVHCFPQSQSEWKITAKAAQKFPQCAVLEESRLGGKKKHKQFTILN